jgi:hypothetical protein
MPSSKTPWWAPPFWFERLITLLVAVPIALLLQPWSLNWWVVDVGVGAVAFVIARSKVSKPLTSRDVFPVMLLALATWAVAFMIARVRGQTYAELTARLSRKYVASPITQLRC